MDKDRFHIKAYSHGIHVSLKHRVDRGLMRGYYDKLSVYDERFIPGRGRVKMLKHTYATYHPEDMSYGLHRNLLKEFLDYLRTKGVPEEEITISNSKDYVAARSSLVLESGVSPYDYQEPIIDYLLKDKPTRVLPLQTGKGKTAISLFTIAKAGVRAAIVMSSMHIETWLKEVKWMFKGDVYRNVLIIKGNKKLIKAIRDAKKGELDQSILLISVGTIRKFIQEYEKGEDGINYGCTPVELYKVLGVGIRITDEAHENLHFNFKHDIETNVNKAIYLSATLESNDRFINRLYETIYPLDSRYTNLKWDKYISVQGLGYGLHQPTKAKYKAYGGRYNHIVYEEWIMADHTRMRNYFNMVRKIIDVGFIKDYQDGMRCLIFFASKQMCEEAAVFLQDYYPKHKVHAYTGDHDDKILHTNDIVCTTLGSSGTGKDIKGLRTVIMTTALLARERNVQVLGRLRALEKNYPGIVPKFYYLTCRDIPRQMYYHQQKVELFEKYAKDVVSSNTTFMV